MRSQFRWPIAQSPSRLSVDVQRVYAVLPLQLRLLLMCGALLLSMAVSAMPAMAAGTPIMTVNGDQITWAQPVWQDEYNKEVGRIYSPIPAGSASLGIPDTSRIGTNADDVGNDPVFAGYDPTQVQAHLRVELETLVASYKAPNKAVGDTSGRLMSDLTNYPGTTKSELGAAARAMLDAISGSGTFSASDIAAVGSFVTTNLGTLGIAVPPTSAPVVGPFYVSGGTVLISSSLYGDAYRAMNSVVVTPSPSLKIADYAKIVSGSAAASTTAAQPPMFGAYTTLLGLSYASWDFGYTQRLRDAGQALFQALSVTAPATSQVKAITTDAAQMLYAASLDGKLANDAAAAELRADLTSALSTLGMSVTLPSPPPVPLPDAIVVRTGDTFVIDPQAGARAYTGAVHAVVDPTKRQVGDTQAISDAIPAAVASVQYTDGMNKPQLQALTFLTALGLSAQWWNAAGDLSTAGRNLYTTMITGKPETSAQLVAAATGLWTAAIKAGVYRTWPDAHLAQMKMQDALTTLLLTYPQLPYLTDILGADAGRAHALMPGTDFAIATPLGGSVANADARLDVPAGCVTAPSLIDVTTLQSQPTDADHSIGAAWSSIDCSPKVSVRLTDMSDPSAWLGYVQPETTTMIDYPDAVTSGNWASQNVVHLTEHVDAKPGVLGQVFNWIGDFIGIGSTQPNCSAVGAESDWFTVNTSSSAWLFCARVRNGVATWVGHWNRSTCGDLSSNIAVTVSGGDATGQAVDDQVAGQQVCPGSTVTATLPEGATLNLSVTPHVGMGLAYHTLTAVDGALTLANQFTPNDYAPFVTSQKWVSSIFQCAYPTFNSATYSHSISAGDVAHTLQGCASSTSTFLKLTNSDVSIPISVGNKSLAWKGKVDRVSEAVGLDLGKTFNLAGKAIGRAADLDVTAVGLFGLLLAEDGDHGEFSINYSAPIGPPPPNGSLPSNTSSPTTPSTDGTIRRDGGPGVLVGTITTNSVGQNSGTMFYNYPSNPAVAYGMNLSTFAGMTTYACIAARRPVRMGGSIPWLNYGQMESTTLATCDTNDPISPVTTSFRNWILREKSGRSYFLDSFGHVRWIASGGVFNCLGQHYYVRDQLTDPVIAQFPSAGNATC